MKKLNILISAYACNPLATKESFPGEAILGWNLVKQISRYHDIWVLTREYNRDAITEEIRNNNISNANFIYVRLPKPFLLLLRNFIGFRLYYLFWQIRAFFLAKRLHQQFKFDLFHQITFNNDWMPSFIGAFLPIPFIWGPVGGGQRIPVSLIGELGTWGFIDEIIIRIIGQSLWRRSIFRNKCVKKASAILVCNQETRRQFSCSDEKIYFFPVNGISSEDLISFDEFSDFAKQSLMKNGFSAIYVGRFDFFKGLRLGIKVFALFLKKYSDSQFIIIGEGPEGNHLKKMVHNLGIESKIHFMPWLFRKKVTATIRNADVFFFPSLREGGGAVVVEAMASGKPVICLDIGGPALHIQGGCGIKIVPKNLDYVINEMVNALERLYLDKELRIKMGMVGRRRAEQFYLWERLGERLQEIYHNALNIK